MKINRIIRALPAVAGMLLLAEAAGAQGTDTRWRAWTGCWKPVTAEAAIIAGTVCVLPAEGQSAVEIVSVAGGKVVDRVKVRADGQAHAVTRDGCTGTESATWSPFGTRLYLKGTLTCEGGLIRTSNAVMSFNQRYEWLDVRGVASGAAQGVAVARYVPVMDTAGLPSEVHATFRDRAALASNAVLAASAPLTLADIAEVSVQTDSGVASTWLMERTQGVKLSLDGKQLAALADQGVSPAVIDVLVAISHPERFAFAPGAQEAQLLPRDGRMTASGASARADLRDAYWLESQSCSLMFYDPWCYESYRMRSPYRYSSYGYDRFGYNGAYGYGFGNPYYGFYPGSQPIIVINRPVENEGYTPPRHGRVVKGQGYTSGGSSGSSGSGSSTTSSPSSSSGGSSAGSSGGSSSGSDAGSGGGSSSSGRTAVRKPPQ